MSQYSIAVITTLVLILIPINDATDMCPITRRVPLEADVDNSECKQEVTKARKLRHPDIGKTTEELITNAGYFLQVYKVITKDGYILTVQRITGGPKSPPSYGKPSVFLNHCMLGSSETWLIPPHDKNLPFKLSDAGYDVWIGNARGTRYSLAHQKLDAHVDEEYWDYSWHEMGIYDVPAVINKILSVTGHPKIYYVGYSMGTSQYFVSLSSIPEMSDKIIVGIMLGPALHMGHTDNPIRFLPKKSNTISQMFMSSMNGYNTYKKSTKSSYSELCTPSTIRCGLCDNFLYFSFGTDTSQMNYTNLSNELSKLDNSISYKVLAHYSQLMKSCNFEQYDYGPIKNLLQYGTTTPPQYNLRQIRTPTYIIHADMDNFSTPDDIQKTKSMMRPEVVKVSRVKCDEFSHLDFVNGKDADTLVYIKVINILNKYLAAQKKH